MILKTIYGKAETHFITRKCLMKKAVTSGCGMKLKLRLKTYKPAASESCRHS